MSTVHLEGQTQQDRNAELQAHQGMDQRFLEAGRALDLRPAMTEPIDESRDAPEG